MSSCIEKMTLGNWLEINNKGGEPGRLGYSRGSLPPNSVESEPT